MPIISKYILKEDEVRLDLASFFEWDRDSSEGKHHCFVKLIRKAGGIYIFLSDLYTNGVLFSLLDDAGVVANRIWNEYSEYFGDLAPENIIWYYRSGEYSSYDFVIPEFNLINLKFEGGFWVYSGISLTLPGNQIKKISDSLDLNLVEDDLKKLPSLSQLFN